MSKTTKKQLQRDINNLATELTNLKIELLEKKVISDEPKPQLKQLDQSIFEGVFDWVKSAAVNPDGSAYLFSVGKDDFYNISDKYGFQITGRDKCKCIGLGYDASNWQNSLIERDTAKEPLEVGLSSELTGSDYYYSKSVTERLENGQELVMCFVSNVSESDAMQERHVEVITSVDTEFNDTDGYGWQYAIPINNQGEPLTASEVGL